MPSSSSKAAAKTATRTSSSSAPRAASSAGPPSSSSTERSRHQQRHVVVVGAGIVGSSTAFFLRRADPLLKVTLVDAATRVASAASGKAGGFLARDWSADPLMRAGFDLHSELAEELGAEAVGYRRLKTISASFSMLAPATTEKSSSSSSSSPAVAPWLSASTSRVLKMGDESTTAQVHPGLLTEKLADRSGADLELGAEVSGLSFCSSSSSPPPSSSPPSSSSSKNQKVKGVTLRDGRELAADAVVLALGPWLGQAARGWALPRGVSLPLVSGQRAHSVVLRPRAGAGGGGGGGESRKGAAGGESRKGAEGSSSSAGVSATAVFAAVARRDRVAEPEFYPRSDGTVYVCGESDDAPLPSAAEAAAAAGAASSEEQEASSSSSSSFDPKRTAALREMAAAVSPAALGLETSELVAEQACYLPLPPPGGNGLPIIGVVRGTDNLFVCGGHSCWGILKGPVSGKRVAEMVVEKLREKWK